jgi:hypothetical protein
MTESERQVIINNLYIRLTSAILWNNQQELFEFRDIYINTVRKELINN